MEKTIERLSKYIDFTGVSLNLFDKSIGASNGYIGKQIRNKASIGSDVLEKIVSTYDDLNPFWLITGKGEMIIAKNQPKNQPNTNLSSEITETKRTQVDFMPKVVTVDGLGRENVLIVPIKARAGYLAGYGDVEYIQKLPAYYMPSLGAGTWRDFEVKGLSMYPTLNEKDRVLSKYCESTNEIKDGRVYVVLHAEEGIIIKRVLNRIKEDGVIICKSDNKVGYPNIVIEAPEILELWEVKFLLTRHLDDPNMIFERMNDLEGRLTMIEQGRLKA